MLAAMCGHARAVRLLLGRGAQLGRRSRRSATAIALAAQSAGSLSALHALLEHPSCTPQLVQQLGFRQRSPLVLSVMSHGSPAVVSWGAECHMAGAWCCPLTGQPPCVACTSDHRWRVCTFVGMYCLYSCRPDLEPICLLCATPWPAPRRCGRYWARAPILQRLAPPGARSQCCTPAPIWPGGCRRPARGWQQAGPSPGRQLGTRLT